jgi:tetratricopeptide (TPR) repeat protein
VPPGSFEASSSRGGAPPEIRPNLISLVSLTHTLCEAGRVQEAEELCRLILKEQPGLAIAQAALGRALYEEGKLDEAEGWLERTVSQTPGCFAAFRWLSEVLVQKGSWDRAHAVLAQAAVLSPENPRVRQLLTALPLPPPGPTSTESGRPAHHSEEIAAQVERPVPKRPRTTEYPAPDYEEVPFVQPEPLNSEEIEEWVTEPHVGGLPPRAPETPVLPAPGWWQRLLELLQRQDWRAVGAAIGVGVGLAVALAIALWVMSGPGQTPLLPPHRASAPPPPPVEKPPAAGSEAAQVRRALERAASNGDLPSLLGAVEQAAPLLGVSEVASARLYATALLASEYGLRIPDDTQILLRRLLESGPTGRLAAEIAGARLLMALAAGDLAAPLPSVEEASATPWLGFALARARRLKGESLRGLDAGTFAPAIVLQAEAALDGGELPRARDLMTQLIERLPAHSRARLLLAEARLAGAQTASADETAALRNACAMDGPRSPVVDGACRLLVAEEARRGGDRAMAHTYALEVATSSPAEPRLLAHTAQLLLNLGETKKAEGLINRAATYAGPAYPPLAWATVGVRINRGEVVPADRLPVASGPDERLLAVRAALARGGAAAIGALVTKMGAQQISADPDLGWFAALSRVQQRKAAVMMAQRYMNVPRPPSPVGAYVLGLLSRWGGRRHLAAYWLSRAREGHGDLCSACVQFAATLTDLGKRPPAGTVPAECAKKSR